MHISDPSLALPFLAEGGEMGTLTRAYNWQPTPVGVPQQWPQSLQTTVSLILTSKFPMFLWWGDEMIQFYNDAYRPSFGQQGKHPTALGQPGADCWPEIWPTIKPLIDEVRQTRQAIWREDQLIPIYRNGHLEDVYWTFSYSPVMSEESQVGGILVIVQETTQKINALRHLQQRTGELATANADLQRSNDNLQLFASAASHDMQEPLRKIRSFGRLLRENYSSTLGDYGADMLKRMESAAERMSHLIQDLMAYSRLITHPKPFTKQALNPIVDGVLNVLDTVIQEKNARIEVTPLGTIQGDATQLAQLFQNLVSNALKFVSQSVTPEIKLRSESLHRSALPPAYLPPAGHEQFCVIRVEDNGIGFEQAQAERIFNAFHRLHGRNEYAGAGLGLAIVKRVVENHQGHIVAQSQPGQGTIFSVYLPS